MQIHEVTSLVPPYKKKKTVGRGGKRGTYSGRGCKGQKARSGGNVNPLFEGGRSTLFDRMKKRRGFTSHKHGHVTVTVEKIRAFYSSGDVVSPKTLVQKGLLREKECAFGVKIIGSGDSSAVAVTDDISLSAGARVFFGKS